MTIIASQNSDLFKDDLRQEMSELKKEVIKFKTDLIKFMFILWIGQVAVTFGFILLFLNK